MKKILIYILLLLALPVGLFAQTTKTVGSGGDYTTLKSAFDAINDGSITGAITLQIISSTTETASAVLNAKGIVTTIAVTNGGTNYVSPTVSFSGGGGTGAVATATETGGVITAINITNHGTGYTSAPTVTVSGGDGNVVLNVSIDANNYSTVNIYPTGTGGYTISGSFDSPLIDLNGADNVTIDGRVNASGSTKSLTLSNISTSGISTIRFINDASSNVVRYCTITGSETDLASGIIFFSNTSLSTGNDNNTIDNNNITNDSGARPVNAIYSFGSSGSDNSGNTISNNNIYDFLNPDASSSGISVLDYSTAWTISNNSFYESSSFTPNGYAAIYNVIQISNTSGVGFTVTGNSIGGSAASCSGTWTKTADDNNAFYAIYMRVGTGTVSSIQNNTIKSFAWSNTGSAIWTGIHIADGAVNIGTGTANTIGTATGTGSITVTGGESSTFVYGINISSTGTIDCQNNVIGSITIANSNSNNSSNFYGIYKSASSGSTTISNNIVGSTSTANSISASSTSSSNSQTVYGIYSGGTGTININTNTVANLSNGTTYGGTGLINGILSSGGTNTVSNNIVHDLTIGNNNTNVNQNASVSGITLTGNSLKTVSANTIYNLSNSNTSFAGIVTGLYFTANTGLNSVSGNFIHSLSVSASSSAGSIYGIKIAGGATTYSNNIISLGGNTETILYGIYETGSSNNNNKLYFNTVTIGGAPTSGSLNSYALYSAVNTNTRNFRNNIFNNSRSNSGATGKHYAIYIVSSGGTFTIDYNDYYSSGTGNVLGYLAADKADLTAWKAATGQDANSLAINPSFSTPGGTIATDYRPNNTLPGVAGVGITTDYTGATRSGTPIMGAFDGYPINVTSSGGTLYASYSLLSDAFTAINTGIHTGTITIKINSNVNQGSTSAVLYQSGYTIVSPASTSSYASVSIYPTSTGLTISGNTAAPLIDLNGASNVTIDGRVNTNGSTKDLTISNTSTSSADGTSTIRFINDASGNGVEYCTIKGSSTATTGGILLFSTGSAGNNGNNIDKNNITCSADANRPVNVVYSLGSSPGNSGNNITNNSIYDFLNKGLSSNGIYLDDYTTTWTISGNSFYETTSFNPTSDSDYSIIRISYTTNEGNGFLISGNFIGGNSASCTGTWTKIANGHDNVFSAIYVNAGTGTASSIQGNTIKNITWGNSSSGSWTGIYLFGGNVNAGTITGNTIGAGTGTASVSITSGATGAIVYGINITSTGTVICQNNTIGSVTVGNVSTGATNFYGINKSAVAGTTTISNNFIGSTSTASSINATSASSGNTQNVIGINNNGTGNITVSGNTIANLANGTTNTAGSLIGLNFNGGTSTNSVSRNFIHSLTTTSGSTTASVYGIKIVAGTTTYSNNIISLGGNTETTIYGIYDTGSGSQTCNLYFNTVYIGGSLGSAVTQQSFGLYSNASDNTRNFRNNIFDNARSTTSGSDLHYAAWFNYAVSTLLTIGNNDYFAPGAGGVLGRYSGSNVTSVQIIPAVETASVSTDPSFANAGGTIASDYRPAASLSGDATTGITIDYNGTTRAGTPTIGAFDGKLISVTSLTGSTPIASYDNLTAAFAAINGGVAHTDSIVIRINGSITETSSAVLNASSGSTGYYYIKIFPTSTGLTISGNIAGPLIDLNGAGNVIIDGRVNGTGLAKDLTISNTNTGASSSTIQFTLSAQNNTVEYCNIKGSETSTTSGILFFSTASTGTGNINNTIDNNNITNSLDANRPANAIYSSGTSGAENSGITISNNNIYNFMNATIASNGINLGAFTNTCTISGNSFYETATFNTTSPVEYNAIRINNTSGYGFVISGNTIGGNAPLCGGSAWTKTGDDNTFSAIYLNAGTSTATSVQSNIIKNFSWSNSGTASWTGINIAAGTVNLGPSLGNTIGASNGTISVTGASGGSIVYGIYSSSTNPVSISNSTISYISNNNTSSNSSTIGLYFSGGSGSNSVKGNFIHSLSVASSATASIYGMNIAAGTTTYSNNIISLGGNAENTIYGVYESGSAGNNTLFFNTVYIGGTPTTGTSINSYALFNNASTNTRDFRNNIFNNIRSNGGSTGTHYAVRLAGTSGLTMNFNDYYAPDNAGVFGYLSGDISTLAAWQSATGQDGGSVIDNPSFNSAGGTIPSNYMPGAGTLIGTPVSVTTDFSGVTRAASPTMGAYENGNVSIWTGASSSDWNTPGNWSGDAVPTSLTNVTIPNVTIDPVISQDLTAPATSNNLTIEAGALLTISDGKALTVTNSITNNGTIKLNSSSSGTASLILNGYIRGAGATEEIQLYLASGYSGDPADGIAKWHYISSPVTSLPVSVFAPGTTQDLAQYVESEPSTSLTQGWIAYDGYRYSGSGTTVTFSSLTPGKGYNFWDNNNNTFTFSGIFNTNTSYAMPLGYSATDLSLAGFNLLGNPFSSGLNWDDIINSVDFPENTSKGVYFTRDNGQCTYISGVGTPGDVTGIIPPMQGFFTKTYSTNNTITIPASARIHSGTHARYKGSNVIPLVRLAIKENTVSDDAVVRFDVLAKTGYDYDFDALKMFLSPSRTTIYSSLGGTDYAINGQPFPQTFVEIPVVVNLIKGGIHSITANQLQGLDNYSVMLIDKTAGLTVDLKTTPALSFSSPSGLISDRFILRVGNVLTSKEDPASTDNKFIIYHANNIMNIQTVSDVWDGKAGSLRIIDLTGKNVKYIHVEEFIKSSYLEVPFNMAQGIYIVEIRSGAMRYVGKVVVK